MVKRELIDTRGNSSRSTRTSAQEIHEASSANKNCDSVVVEDNNIQCRVLWSKYLTVKNRISGNLIVHDFSYFFVSFRTFSF